MLQPEESAATIARKGQMSPVDARPSAVVFGGSGFVGFHLCHELVRRGYRVTVCDLIAPRPDAAKTDFAVCDVRDEIRLPVEDVDIVFNLAAVHRTPGHEDFEYYETNVRGALNVINWCARQSVTRLVFTSSISVYGPTEEPVTEESAVAPSSSYGRSKLIAEELHKKWAEASQDRRLVMVRPAVIFGMYEQGNFTRLASALRRRRFAYPGRSDTIKSCGYVQDLIESLFFALDRKDPLPLFNFAYPKRYTIREICETFSRAAGYARPATIPSPLLRVAASSLPKGQWARNRAFHAERVAKLLASTNVYPGVLEAAGFCWSTTLDSALMEWRTANLECEYA